MIVDFQKVSQNFSQLMDRTPIITDLSLVEVNLDIVKS